MISSPKTVGRVRIAAVLSRGAIETGALLNVLVSARPAKRKARLTYPGFVHLADTTKRHCEETLIPLIDSAAEVLGVSLCDYDLTIQTPGAYSASETELRIPGFSADVVILLALISTTFNIPIHQDFVATGHIASVDGAIGFVRSIPAKLNAAEADGGVSRFFYPRLDGDSSLTEKTPDEKRRAQEAVGTFRENIQLIAVARIDELIPKVFDQVDLLLAALENGYFRDSHADLRTSNSIVASLARADGKMFWRTIDLLLQSRRLARTRDLFAAFTQYQIARERYPENIGRFLYERVIALPGIFHKDPHTLSHQWD